MPNIIARGGSRRRTINEINMVPFIDVMLVLLIIFMVSAPMITTGVVDLPSMGANQKRPERVIEIIVASDESIKLRIGNAAPQAIDSKSVARRVLDLQAGNTLTPVIISADRKIKYEGVVKVMDSLQRSGVQRVGLSMKIAS